MTLNDLRRGKVNEEVKANSESNNLKYSSETKISKEKIEDVVKDSHDTSDEKDVTN